MILITPVTRTTAAPTHRQSRKGDMAPAFFLATRRSRELRFRGAVPQTGEPANTLWESGNGDDGLRSEDCRYWQPDAMSRYTAAGDVTQAQTHPIFDKQIELLQS